MKKLILGLFIILGCFTFIGASSAEWFDYFVSKDNQMFCAEFMKDEFKPCIEFKGRIKSKEDLQQIDKDFVVINDKGYCIKDSKEADDVSICDNISLEGGNGKSFRCVIKGGIKTCTELTGDNNPISYDEDGALVVDRDDMELLSDNEDIDGSNSSDSAIFTENTIPVGDAALNSTCKVNGKEVPCDQMMEQAGGLIKLFGGMWVIGMVMAIVLGIFWLWMLIDVIKHQKENKALWIIVIVFVNSLGAVIYYFVAKRPRDKLEKQEQQMVQPAQIPVQSTESSSVESVVSNQAPEVVSTQPTSLQRPPQNTPSI